MTSSQSLRKLPVLTKAQNSPAHVLLLRCLMLLALVSTVMTIFWLDRDGLKDYHDDYVSFKDVVYFTAVTISTTGYGDIVPITDETRFLDTLVVTPLRLLIWFIFIGTAYEFVLQHWLETWRMKRLQSTLNSHLIICGFGHSGQSAAGEALALGLRSDQIVIIENREAYLNKAIGLGFLGVLGDASRKDDLLAACVSQARSIIVCLGQDNSTVLSVLTIRQLNPQIRIICSVKEADNVKLIQHAGANSIISPSLISGYLMADSIDASFVTDYIGDLMTSAGRVKLADRTPTDEEIGKPMRAIEPGLVVRLHRGAEVIGFWEGEKAIIQPGDILLEIRPTVN